MDYFDPFGRPFWTVAGVAVLCGAIVGLERQLRGKPAGVRTSILVCLGTAIYVRLGSALAADGTDPTRVLGQLVTGIGFLGAGVMFSNQGTVTGVTTAAVIDMDSGCDRGGDRAWVLSGSVCVGPPDGRDPCGY